MVVLLDFRCGNWPETQKVNARNCARNLSIIGYLEINPWHSHWRGIILKYIESSQEQQFYLIFAAINWPGMKQKNAGNCTVIQPAISHPEYKQCHVHTTQNILEYIENRQEWQFSLISAAVNWPGMKQKNAGKCSKSYLDIRHPEYNQCHI